MKIGDLVRLSDYYVRTFGVAYGIIMSTDGLFVNVAWVSDETIQSLMHASDLEVINESR